MMHLIQDSQFALRSFRKSPGFSAVAILSLALGIGANTAIFTLVDQLILRLLPIKDPQRIVLLQGGGKHYGGNNGRNALSYPMYQDIRERNSVFSGTMCRYSLSYTLGTSAQTEVVSGELVSGNYFPLLGVRPAIGRLFTDGDDAHVSGHPFAVLSYAYWKSRFAGDPGAIGQTIRINDYPLAIVGVAQPGFDGVEPGLPAEVFVPMAMTPNVRSGFTRMLDRRLRWVNVYGRLKAGVSREQAAAGLQPLFHQILDSEVTQPAFRNASPYDKEQFLRMWLNVLPGSQGNSNLRRKYEKPLIVLMGVVGLVLLIACANLASLLTARATSRQKEIAIRLAIGSSRGRVVEQLLTESLLLSAAGGVAGIALAVVMVKGLLAFLPSAIGGYAISSSPDYRMLAFTFGLSLFTGMAFGLVPALQSTKPNIAPTLKDEAGGVIGGTQVNFRKVLVGAQVTLSLLLLIGAGLFIRSLGNLRTLDPGFRVGNLVQFRLSPRSLGYDSNRTGAFSKRLEERLSGIPGVRAVGLAEVPMLSNNDWENGLTIQGYQAKPGEDMTTWYNDVTPGYFDTMGMHLLTGRGFTAKDDAKATRVAIVNASFAKHYFGDQPALGHRIGEGTDPGTPTDIEIVGVVNDTRYESLRTEIHREYFLCALQRELYGIVVYVRTERAPESAFHAIRATVREIDPNLPIIDMKTFENQVDESLVTERMIATLSAAFGILATVLAVIGLYGVMAYMVARRAREIGIRMALGAQTGNVVWLVMREVLVLVFAGVVVGLPAAYGLTRLIQAQLYGVAPNDPASMAAATLLLSVVALLAGYIPARRAAGFDPAGVLRSL
jgi:predicted permease